MSCQRWRFDRFLILTFIRDFSTKCCINIQHFSLICRKFHDKYLKRYLKLLNYYFNLCFSISVKRIKENVMLEKTIAKLKEEIVIIKNPDGSNGTGIILDDLSIIVTNSHVVTGCRNARIETNDRKPFIAKVIYSNKIIDFAFLLCNNLNINTRPVLSSRENILEGEDVVAIGHPFGYGFTVTKGIISSLRREVKGIEYIQTDVPINPGNSGGPLIDSRGEIIGINTWIVSNAQNLSFAVPSKYIIEAYNSLPPVEKILSGYYCPACGKMNDEKTKYCNHCGHQIFEDRLNEKIVKDTGYCIICRTQNEIDEKYCKKCGAKLLKKEEPKNSNNAGSIKPNETIECPGCGHKNRGQKYCRKCGKTLI